LRHRLDGDAAIKKEWLMNLTEWEPTIQAIVDESKDQNESGKQKIMKKWRAKLEGTPTRLEPFKIDKIVREVRRRLDRVSR
jgi:hypothetical protein